MDVSGSTVTDANVQKFETSAYGFYWAGAVVANGNVFFGGDNGMLYWRKAGENFASTGGSLDLKTASSGATDAGDVRSTIVLGDDGNLYFTSKGGYLWCCKLNALNNPTVSWKVALSGASTSTPTIAGNRIYVGVYGNAGKGIRCVNIETKEVTKLLETSPIQSSIIVMRSGNTDYLYFTVNAAATATSTTGAGGGYCYSVTNSATPTTATMKWGCACAYSLAGMAIENGIAVFGNDSNALYIVK